MSGEPFVNGGVRNRSAVVLLECGGIIPGRRQIESTHSSLLEWGSRIIRSVDRAAQDWRSRYDIKLVGRRNVEEIVLPSVADAPLTHLTVPLEQLVVVPRRVLREMIHHCAH